MKSKKILKFKETEIGKIPVDWEMKKMVELVQNKSDVVAGPFGSNLITNDYRSQGIPIIQLQNIERYRFITKNIKFIDKVKYNKLKYHSFIAGDIVLAKLGDPIGKTCILPDELLMGIVTADVVRIRIPHNVIDNNFLLYVLNSDNIKNQLYSRQLGTTRPRVNLSDVRELLLPIPPLIIQQKIGKILSELDTKIKNLQKQNKILEQIAQAVFKSWFVDYEFPDKNGKPYKSFEGEMVYNEQIYKKIPKKWRVGKYSELVDVTTGKGLKRSHYVKNGKYAVLGANGELGRTNNFLFDENLILAGRVGTLGQIHISKGKVWISDNVLISKPKTKQNFHYSYFIIKNFDFESMNRGSTQPLVTQTDLKNKVSIIPDHTVLFQFENMLLSIFNKIFSNNQQNKKLTGIRDILLQQLMSGQIRIPVDDKK